MEKLVIRFFPLLGKFVRDGWITEDGKYFIYRQNTPEELATTELHSLNIPHVCRESGDSRIVLGTCSQDATWVTEGMEISEKAGIYLDNRTRTRFLPTAGEMSKFIHFDSEGKIIDDWEIYWDLYQHLIERTNQHYRENTLFRLQMNMSLNHAHNILQTNLRNWKNEYQENDIVRTAPWDYTLPLVGTVR